MAKKREVSGAGSNFKKIFLWVFAVIVLLVVAFAVYALVAFNSNSDVETILSYENNYLLNENSFNTEYEVATPNEVSGTASLARALAGIYAARPYLQNMESNASEIVLLVSSVKGDYSGDELVWFEQVEGCYLDRSALVSNYSSILDNEEKYFLWYNESSAFDANYEEFVVLVDDFIQDADSGDKQSAIDNLNKMKQEIAQMKQNCVNAEKQLSFNFVQKYLAWAETYDELVDLMLQYYADPSTDLERRITTKSNEASTLITEAQSSKGLSEFDEWWTAEVVLKQDEAERLFNSAQAKCGRASDLFETAFPGNANVIKEINVTNN